MKKYISLLLLLVSFQANADKSIICSGASCSSNFTAQTIEKPQYTAITIPENNEHVTVSVPNGQAPRSLRVMIENNNFPGKNVILDLSSKTQASNSGNTIVIGDSFANVTMKLNGYNGAKGRDVSELCAERIKAGNYGEDAKIFFNTRRQSQEGLNPNRCDRTDLTYLQSFGFTCDDNSYTSLAGINPVVDVKRLKTKARCTGILVQDMCLKRKVIATCTYRAYWVNCGKKGGCDTGYSGDPYTFQTQYAEENYNYLKSVLPGENFCRNQMPPYGGLQALIGYGAYLTSPGVNPANSLPLPGSNWELYYTSAYGRCLTYWTTVRTIYSAVNAYSDNGTSCNDVGVAEDPNGLIPWAYNGMAQEPQFGPELLSCSPGECPVQSTLSDLDRSIDVIVPESGTSGTQQGSGTIFAYDIQNIQSEASIGQAGAAGSIDIESPESTKYCGKIRDYDTDGADSDFARSPNVSFRRYRWKSIKTESGGNNGVAPTQNGNTINIYKKLDSFQRYLLYKQLL